MVPVLVARGVILLVLEPLPEAFCSWASMRALRWTFSKLKPPLGAVSRPISGLVNSDMVIA